MILLFVFFITEYQQKYIMKDLKLFFRWIGWLHSIQLNTIWLCSSSILIFLRLGELVSARNANNRSNHRNFWCYGVSWRCFWLMVFRPNIHILFYFLLDVNMVNFWIHCQVRSEHFGLTVDHQLLKDLFDDCILGILRLLYSLLLGFCFSIFRIEPMISFQIMYQFKV